MSKALKTGSVVLLFLAGFGNTYAQKLYEQTLKFEQALEWISRYYVDTVNREILMNNAISEMLKELGRDTTGIYMADIQSLQKEIKPHDQYENFGKILEWVNEHPEGQLSDETIVEHGIGGMLESLDPHSSYLTREEVAALNEPLQGNFEGIGVSFNILNDTIYIISPVEGGPSARVGIVAGDRIIKVDGNNVAGIGMTSDKVFELLRGKKGTKVSLSILRKGNRKLMEFEVIRDKIPILSVDASYKVDDKIGYIKISRFSMTTMEEFQEALNNLKKENIESLILDLTGNGGGYLEVAINLADQFLEAGKLILYTEGAHSPRREYSASRDGSFESGHLVILIDEGSASASEILTGAIQDWDDGIIVGRRSYGKGLVQRPLMLVDQSMIRLTIARYYTPTGRLIQKPYTSGRDDYDKELYTRYLNGEFAHRDSIHLPDSLKYFTLKNTRLVYGGGGIMPDYFVSIDTSYYSNYYRELVSKGAISRFVLEYIDNHRNELLKQYPDIEIYKYKFQVSDALMNDLTSFASKQGIPLNNNDLAVSRGEIELILKAYIARDLWSNSEFYEISNESKPDFKTAVSILKNWDKYEAMLLNSK